MNTTRKPHATPTRRWFKVWFDVIAENRLGRFAMVLFGVWLCAADSMIVVTIMPSISQDLGAHAWLSWSVSAFMFGGILACSSSGRLAELIGLQRATIMAGLVFTVGTLFDAVAADMRWFLLGRLAQGVGAGWISGFIMVAVAYIFPEKHLAKVFAFTTSIWALATLIGPLIGAYLSDISHWRVVFYLFAFQGLVFCVAAYFLLRDTLPEKGPGIPWLQLGLLALAILAIAAANLASDLIANVVQSLLSVTFFVLIGAGLLVYLCVRDKSLHIRLLPKDASNLQSVTGSAYLTVFSMVAASMAFTSYGPALLQQNAGLNTMQAGYVFGAESLAWTAAALYAARFNEAKKIAQLIRVGASCVLFGAILLTATMQGPSISPILIAAIILGAGFGFSFAHISRQVFRVLSKTDLAIGSSALMSVRQIGAAFASAVTGIAANLAGWTGLRQANEFSHGTWLPHDLVSAIIFGSVIPFGLVGCWAAMRLAVYVERA